MAKTLEKEIYLPKVAGPKINLNSPLQYYCYIYI